MHGLQQLHKSAQEHKQSLPKYKVITPEGEVEVHANSQDHANVLVLGAIKTRDTETTTTTKTKKIRTVISYLFTAPASVMFFVAEKIRGEKISWRYKEVVKNMEATCSKCGHKGTIKKIK